MEMRLRGRAGLAVLLAIAAWLPASSQSATVDAPAASGLRITGMFSRVAAVNSGEVVREINDPQTGDQWMLMRDPVHPEGPGRLVLAGGPAMRLASAGTTDETPHSVPRAILTPFHPEIHAGDALIVEEHTAVVEARLEAVALGPAVQGAVFKARLKMGGKVVRAIAVAAGSAVFAPADEAQP